MQVTIYAAKKVVKAVDVIAEKENRSRSSQVVYWIKKGIREFLQREGYDSMDELVEQNENLLDEDDYQD